MPTVKPSSRRRNGGIRTRNPKSPVLILRHLRRPAQPFSRRVEVKGEPSVTRVEYQFS